MESILFDSKNAQMYKFGLHILDYVPKNMKQSIIDIGSGSGSLTKELMSYGGNVIGIDKDINVIAHAKEKYPTVPFYVMDALRLQYENRFDIAFSNATVHEIEDKKKLFASIHKCLKQGGKFIAEFATSKGNQDFLDELNVTLKDFDLTADVFTYYLIDRDECIELLEETGFSIEHIEEYSRKTYVRGNDDMVRELMDKTISKKVSGEKRERLIGELMNICERRYKSNRGWMKDVSRIRLVAVKE